MSSKVVTWVWEQAKASGSTLLVLLAIADDARDDGQGAHPTIVQLAHKTAMSERAVRDRLRKLEALGLIQTSREEGRRNSYRIVMASVDAHGPVPAIRPEAPPIGDCLLRGAGVTL